MTRKEIRIELLGQHTQLRHGIFEMRALAKRWMEGLGSRDDVRARLLALGVALENHNDREEELLRGILGTVDRLGPERVAIMNERHLEEHHEIYGALVVASESASPEAAVPLLEFLFGRMLEHMVREEDAFLGPDVLGGDEDADAAFG